MERDTGDILDRGSIAKLKFESIRNEYNDKEWHDFEIEVNLLEKKYKHLYISFFFKLLYDINSYIWEKESDMRQGKLDGVLYEVGLRAIEIRKLNNLRVTIKNLINKFTKTGYQDKKENHLSE